MDLNPDILYIFTDGSCYPNPGPGGWAALMLYNGHCKMAYGGSDGETNNSMELRAIAEALKLRKDHTVQTVLFTDSQYCVNALTKWWKGWEKKGWITGAGKPVKNQDYIREIIHLYDNVSFKWVKGHNGNAFNEAADQLARKGRACVEENPHEDPDIEDIRALIDPYVGVPSLGDPPFEADEQLPGGPALVEKTTKPSRSSSVSESSLRDILAGIWFMQRPDSHIEDCYVMADDFLEKKAAFEKDQKERNEE